MPSYTPPLDVIRQRTTGFVRLTFDDDDSDLESCDDVMMSEVFCKGVLLDEFIRFLRCDFRL